MAASAPEVATAEQPPESGTPAESPRSRLRINFRSKNVRVIALLVFIMTAEAVVMSMFLPQPAHDDAVEEEAEANQAKGSHGGHGGQGSDHGGGQAGDTLEMTIDKFNTTNSRAVPNTILHVSFTLVAVVAHENQKAFEEEHGAHTHRIRQAIEEICRSATIEDLSDPNLNALKRLIRSEVNKVLHASYVIEVVISEFKTMTQ
jgi:flagellar basal body-associated protein FliL